MKNNLRLLRKQKGLTLLELANALADTVGLMVTPDTIAKYERGEREPKLDAWNKLALYFDVAIPYLMGISDNKEIIQPDTKYEPTNIHDENGYLIGQDTPLEINLDAFLYQTRAESPNSVPTFLQDILHGSPVYIDDAKNQLSKDDRKLLNSFIESLLNHY